MTKYRVAEYTDRLGFKTYVPQKKWLFWWRGMEETNRCGDIVVPWFMSELEAIEYINLHVNTTSKKNITKTTKWEDAWSK